MNKKFVAIIFIFSIVFSFFLGKEFGFRQEKIGIKENDCVKENDLQSKAEIYNLPGVNYYNEGVLSINAKKFEDYDKIKNIKFNKIIVKNIVKGQPFFGQLFFTLDTEFLELHVSDTEKPFFDRIYLYNGDSLTVYAMNSSLDSIFDNFKGNRLTLSVVESLGIESLKKIRNWKGEYLYLDISHPSDVKDENDPNTIKQYELTKEEAEIISNFDLKYVELGFMKLTPEVREILRKNTKITWDPAVYEK